MQPSDRDRRLISNILEDAETLNQRRAYFSITKERFVDDLSFEGEIAYDSLMLPVYTIVEDAVHLSDNLMMSLSDCPWDEIRGFRNIVAHGYRTVNRDIAWQIIDEDIPQLAKRLSEYIDTAA